MLLELLLPEQSRRVLQYPGYRAYWLARFSSTMAQQIITVAVGWQVYDITRDPLDLGLVGLTQFLPLMLLVTLTGSASDRYSRRTIMLWCIITESLVALGLVALALSDNQSTTPVFGLLILFGITRAFLSPASTALAPNLVPRAQFPDAVALNTVAWQIATICGPVGGGLLYGISAGAAYGFATLMLLGGAWLVALIPRLLKQQQPQENRTSQLLGGFAYVWREKLVLGAISLDMFAVMLAGAVALMPVYARDILEIGPTGLGLMRAAPGVGAILVAMVLMRTQIRNHAGVIMFVCVALFGLATALFGLSTSAWLSISLLVIIGATDMFSVYIREVLIQLRTDDSVRGRVNAVNMMFIGASNELGEFRAGVSASFFGAVPAVVVGGVGAVLIAGTWAWLFPGLRQAKRLN